MTYISIVKFQQISDSGKYTENLQDEYEPQYLVVKVELTDWHLFVNFFP
jgi:hypothetical protein